MFFRRRRRSQEDFAAELEAHIALEAERLRGEGKSEADARVSAVRAFGNPLGAQEQFYDRSHTLWIDRLKKDLVYAFRTLRHNPTFTAAAVLTLALGIGANTALFTVIDGVLLQPLPYPQPGRIFMIYGRAASDKGSLSPADFLDYRAQSQSFESMAAYRETALNLAGNDQPKRTTGAVVTAGFFSVMKVQAELGRVFVAELDRPGDGRLVVLSDSLWRRYYGSDENIIGKSVEIDGEPRTVVGVMPPSFRFPDLSEAWLLSRYAVPEHALRPQIDQSHLRDTHYFEVVGRLAHGISIAQARAEMDGIGHRLKQQFGKDEEYDTVSLISLQDDVVGETKPALLILLGAVTLLLLIACVNVANILVARGASRQKEMAIRGALGAGKARIVVQLLTESLLVAAAGGLLGVGLAYAAISPLRSWIPPDVLLGAKLELDLRVLGFTAIVALGSGLFFGLFPALQMTKSDLTVALKESGRGTTGDRRSQKMRSFLVISEIALATVLVIGAALLIRSFSRVLATPGGFNSDHVLTMQTSLSPARYPTPAQRVQFAVQSLDRIRALPGVLSSSLISRLPLNRGRSWRGVIVKGRPAPPEDDGADYLVISPDYFTAMGVRLTKGRAFTERDDATLILNESAARKFFPNGDALGQFVQFDTNDPWLQVIGIVGDVRQHQLDQVSPSAVYVPYLHDPWPFMAFVVRMTPLQPSSVEAAIHTVDKDQPVYNVRSMEEVVSGSLSSRRFGTLLLGLFGIVALTLASVGIYGVMAYSVAQRSTEIGIRMALGAEAGAVLALVLFRGLRLAVAGVVLGVILSLGLTRFLSTVLYGVGSTDGLSFAGSCLLLLVVAILASYIPALRATKVDPVVALRAS